MVPVRFVRGMSPYQAGETAGFPDEVARRLVSIGVAVPVQNARPASATVGLERPPADKMVRRGSARTKSRAQGGKV